MLNDKELVFDMVNSSHEAIIAIDLQGKVLFWNTHANNLFGYSAVETLGKSLPIITLHSKYELEKIIETAKEKKQTCFRTQKFNKEGKALDLVVNSHPIIKDNSVIGVSLLIKDFSIIKNVCYLPLDIEYNTDREPKRTFAALRNLILLAMEGQKKTINQISNDSGVNWKTVEKHLTYLIGKRLVEEVFSSEYVRIFNLTEQGKDYVEIIRDEIKERFIKDGKK